MFINFEELKSTKVLNESFRVDYTNKECIDALLVSVNYADIEVNAYCVDDIDVHLSLSVNYEFKCLDAINLDDLIVERQFEEEVLFTNNQARADEMDIDYFVKEIDIEELVFQFILVDVPFNYSEQKRVTVKLEDLEETYNPFADLI